MQYVLLRMMVHFPIFLTFWPLFFSPVATTFQKKLGPAPQLFFPLPSQPNLFPVQGIYLPKSYLPTSSQAPFLLISSPRHPADFNVTFLK